MKPFQKGKWYGLANVDNEMAEYIQNVWQIHELHHENNGKHGPGGLTPATEICYSNDVIELYTLEMHSEQ